MTITLQQLRIFCCVADSLSFSDAARELYLSQPHVSTQIKKLEGYFRTELFNRSSRGVELTAPGAIVFERAQRIIDDVHALDGAMKQFREPARRVLHIASTETAGNWILPGLLAAFQVEHPGVQLTLQLGNSGKAIDWLLQDQVEVAISAQSTPHEDLVMESFYADELVVICAPNADLPDQITLDELAASPKVMREAGSASRAHLEQLLADRSTEATVVAELHGNWAVNEAVARGMGLGVVAARSAVPWIHSGKVRPLTLLGHDLSMAFYVVHKRAKPLPPAAQAFLRALEAYDFSSLTHFPLPGQASVSAQ